MSAAQTQSTRAREADPREQCRAALAALERAIPAPPIQLSQEVDTAQRFVVNARDALIERLRREGTAQDGARIKDLLGRLNTALSLMASSEYPASGIQRKPVEQARDLLKGLVSESW